MRLKGIKLGIFILSVGGMFLTTGSFNIVKGENILDKPFNSVKPYIQIRPRYENVHIKNSPNKDASALTTRIKVGVKINGLFQINGLDAVLEGVDVEALIDDYNPQKNNYEKVLDPDNSRLTQGYIFFKLNKTTFFFGRRYIAIDDHRFIGTVNWR